MAVFGGTALAGNTYYVSITGNDGSDGLSVAAAWRTMAFATGQLARGDTLIVRSGNYGNDQGEIIRSGTADEPIVIRAETAGAAVFAGDGSGTGLTMWNQSHIVIEGLTFTNFLTGLNVRYKSTYVTVRKCAFVENTVYGLLLYGWKDDPSLCHHHTFTQNEFYDGLDDNQDYGIALYFSTHVRASNNYFFGWHHQALSFKKLMFDSVASDNTFEGFRFTGIYLGQNEDGDEGILRCENLIAERNAFRPAIGFRAKRPIMVANVTRGVVRDNFMEGKADVDGGWGEGVGVSTSSIHAKIYRNVIRRMGGTTSNPGLRMYGDAQGTKVFHNTIALCAYGLGFETFASVLFQNNIFSGNGGMIRGSDAADARNCTFLSNDIYPDWSGKGATDISADPLFTGPFTALVLGPEDPKFVPDFGRAKVCRLQAGSPCLDAGAPLTLTSGPGSGTEIPVLDAEYFVDGFGIVEGDLVRVGSADPARVTAVDYQSSVITVNRSLSWEDGDGVCLAYSGSGPDMGALEDLDPPVLTLKTIKVAGRVSRPDATLTINGTDVSVGTDGRYAHVVTLDSVTEIVVIAKDGDGETVERTISIK